MSEPKDISIIPGNTRILLIAPHSKETDLITREAVKILGCSGIVNDVVKRADRDYNKFSHASKDEKFIRGIETVVKADGPTLVVWIHGAKDTSIDKEARHKASDFNGEPKELHALIGYGQGTNPIDKKDTKSRLTAEKEMVERFRDLLTQNGMTTILTRPDAEDFRGRDPNNMNQWFVENGYNFDQVQSIQLEIRRKGFRNKNDIMNTARIISSALKKLIPPAQKIADKPIEEHQAVTEVLNAPETTPFDDNGKDIRTSKETQKGKDLALIVSKPISVIEEQADDALVQKVYSWLQDRFKKHVVDFMLEAGKHIIKEFYDNDPQKVLDKKPVRDKSLSLLIKELKQSSGDAPSRSWFFDAVGLAAHEMIFKKQGVQTFGQLGHSQKLLLLHVPDWRKKERFAEDAIKAKYTVRDFKDHIKTEMDRIKTETYVAEIPDAEQKAKLTVMLKEFRQLIKQYGPVPISVAKFLSFLKRSVKAEGKKAKKKDSGFNEWTDNNINFCTGCENDCIYCYAHTGAARRFKQLKGQEWHEMKIRKHDVGINRPFYGGLVGFPSTHDILPSNIEEYMTVLCKLLRAGNDVLIVSKPRFDCIKIICEACRFFQDKILFRFTIGAMDDQILSFWEPNAPVYAERKACLEYCFDEGFQTSVSMEPMLDTAHIDKVIADLIKFVNVDIWLGTMNHLASITKPTKVNAERFSKEIEIIEAGQTKEKLEEIYLKHKDNPKIRYKKDFRQKIGIKDI